jgi:hypothetical protein
MIKPVHKNEAISHNVSLNSLNIQRKM